MDASNWVSSLASVIVAVGVIFVWWQARLLGRQIEQARQQLELSHRALTADHERSRRELTINAIREWIRDVKPESSAADKLVSKWNDEQCRNLANHLPVKIKPEQKDLAEACLKRGLKNPGIGNDRQIVLDESEVTSIRYYAVGYLNSIETALLGWQLNIADRETIEQQFAFLYRPEEGYDTLEKLRTAFGRPNSFPAIERFIENLRSLRKSEAPESKPPIA